MGRVLKKEGLGFFLEKLKKEAELVAPVTTDMTRFQVVQIVSEIDIHSGNPFFPIKKYFLPKKEAVLKIKNGKTIESKFKLKKRIIFGVKLCDINGLKVLDKLFMDHNYKDYDFIARRESTTVIGVNCLTPPSEFCFCGSMDLKKEGYDLLFHEREKDYYIDVLTEKGHKLVVDLPEEEFDYPLPVTDKTLEKKNLWNFYADNYWEKDSQQCVSCQRCTLLCPTCFCFDICDVLKPGTKDGERVREIDSCHSEKFTEVAGGHIFRDSRLKRYRHRVMHKLQFFDDKFQRSMCTGCGRCIEYCHSRIDFVNTINEDFK